MTYKEYLIAAMEWLAEQENTVFVGQGVGAGVGGTFMSCTLDSLPASRRIELPVAEQLQVQLSTGLSIDGACVVSIFPRQNFLLYGLADLINVTDKLKELCHNEFQPHVIIRTALGRTEQFPGIQHSLNFIDEFINMLPNMDIYSLDCKEDILSLYQHAYHNKRPAILIEYGDYYDN